MALPRAHTQTSPPEKRTLSVRTAALTTKKTKTTTTAMAATTACLFLVMMVVAALPRSCEAGASTPPKARVLKYLVKRYPTNTGLGFRYRAESMCAACFPFDIWPFCLCPPSRALLDINGVPNGLTVGNDNLMNSMALVLGVVGLASYQCARLSFFSITQLPNATSLGQFQAEASLPASFETVGFAASVWAPQGNDKVQVTAANSLPSVLELVGFPSYFNDTVAEGGAVPTGGVRTYPDAPATDYTFRLDPSGTINAFLLSNLALNDTWASAALFYLNATSASYRVSYALYKKSSATGDYNFYGFEATFTSAQSGGGGNRRLLQASSVERSSISGAQTACTLIKPTPPGCFTASCRIACR